MLHRYGRPQLTVTPQKIHLAVPGKTAAGLIEAGGQIEKTISCLYCFQSTCPQEHPACLAGIKPAEVVAGVSKFAEGVWQKIEHPN